MNSLVITIAILIILYLIYKLVTVKTKKAEAIVPQQKSHATTHYYIVKELVLNKDDLSVISEMESEFSNLEMVYTKILATKFYDDMLISIKDFENGIDIEKSTKTVFEFYLVRNADLVIDKRYLLKTSDGFYDQEVEKLEEFLLSTLHLNKKPYNFNSSNETFITTKNSFLDGSYKD